MIDANHMMASYEADIARISKAYDANIKQQQKTIAHLLEENAVLRKNWLTEQEARLAQTDLIETYRAVKAKLEIARLKAENEILRQGLTDVTDPIGKIRREMPEGYRLDGCNAAWLSDDANHLKEIALKALEKCRNVSPDTTTSQTQEAEASRES